MKMTPIHGSEKVNETALVFDLQDERQKRTPKKPKDLIRTVVNKKYSLNEILQIGRTN